MSDLQIIPSTPTPSIDAYHFLDEAVVYLNAWNQPRSIAETTAIIYSQEAFREAQEVSKLINGRELQSFLADLSGTVLQSESQRPFNDLREGTTAGTCLISTEESVKSIVNDLTVVFAWLNVHATSRRTNREEEWRAFIASLANPPCAFDIKHISAVFTRWDELSSYFDKQLSLPLTQPTNAGNIQLAWDKGRHYVEVDILPDGRLEWFYRDRETNELDGTEEEPDSAISEALVLRLDQTVW